MVMQEEQSILLRSEMSEAFETDSDSIENILLAQTQLAQVKESLGIIIDTLAQNQSRLSRAAYYWGELPLWQKIAGGVALISPSLVVGIAAQISALLVISGVTVLAYTASGVILDDHYHYNVDISDRLKAGIFTLVDVLQITISALDVIRQKLASEIKKFKVENLKLTANVIVLGEQIEILAAQAEIFIATERLMRATQTDLEITAQSFRVSYEHSQFQLSEKIIELGTVRVSMGLEVDKVKKIAATLQGAVQTLSGTVIEDTEQRLAFQDKLDTFLSDKAVSFDQVTERICHAEQELLMVKVELKRSNEIYQELLERHERQVVRLEHLDFQMASEHFIPQVPLGQLLKSIGFYAIDKTSIYQDTPFQLRLQSS